MQGSVSVIHGDGVSRITGPPEANRLWMAGYSLGFAWAALNHLLLHFGSGFWG
jgi:hypothetical protein